MNKNKTNACVSTISTSPPLQFCCNDASEFNQSSKTEGENTDKMQVLTKMFLNKLLNIILIIVLDNIRYSFMVFES